MRFSPPRAAALLALVAAVAGSGCKERGPKGPSADEAKGLTVGAGPPGARSLPEDRGYAQGSIRAAVLKMETHVVHAGPAATDGEAGLAKARKDAAIRQTMVVSDARGKIVSDSEEFILPRGTELRYNAALLVYALCDMKRKQYWAMKGAEVGNLLEGGPEAHRTSYTIAFTERPALSRETLVGIETEPLEALVAFDYRIKLKDGEKSGRVKLTLQIWHTEDKRLEPAWRNMLIDLLTMPFQDDQGQTIVAELKRRVAFPLMWSVEVDNPTQKREAKDLPARIVTRATALTVKSLPQSELAAPPAGFTPAKEPFQFALDGQTVSEEILGTLPARKGPPPANLEPPE